MRDVAGSWTLEAAGEALETINEAAVRAGPQTIEQGGEVLAYVMDWDEYDHPRRSQARGDEPDPASRT